MLRYFLILALTCTCFAAPVQQPHASQKAAIQFLREEGIISGKTRVKRASWTGTFWVITLRHPSGKLTNWSVNAASKDYSYICEH